jgi:hypothetical protein
MTRVGTIRIADGFATDAGEHVSLGEEPAVGPDDPLGIALVVGDEDSRWVVPGKACQVKLPVTVQALASVDLDAPWLAVEALIGDIKRAVEVDDTLEGKTTWSMTRGPVQTLAREPGATTVGAKVPYWFEWKEGWGTP